MPTTIIIPFLHLFDTFKKTLKANSSHHPKHFQFSTFNWHYSFNPVIAFIFADMILPVLFIAPSTKGGRGVFSSKKIKAGTVIEISPVLVISPGERKIIEQTKLFNYIFEWGASRRKAAVAFGYISMYNHDYDANCAYDMDFDNDLMTLTTVRDIDEGEEIYINYNASPADKTPLWFNAK